MSFQAYIDNIKAKTGKSPDDFRKLAEKKGFLKKGELTAKAGDVVAWLKEDFDLGHGHAMAIYAVFKGIKQATEVTTSKKTATKTAKPTAKKVAKPIADENDTEAVNTYMAKLIHPLKAEIETVRTIIKKANKNINERIKWNAPSFFYKDDIVTFNHRQEKFVQLVFHYAGVVNIKSPLLTGDYKDRRLAAFKDLKEIKTNKKELERIINELVKMIDKQTT